MRRSVPIFKNELLVLRRDPAWLILIFVIPLILVGLMRGGVHFILVLTGHPGASGADFSVPAQAVTFVFYLPALIGLSFLREHGWSTWVRLRASGIARTHLLLGKVLPIVVLGLLQMLVVFGVGSAVYGLQIRGSVPALALVAAALVVTVVTMGLAITAVVRTVEQLNAIGNIAPVALGALGGALMPLLARSLTRAIIARRVSMSAPTVGSSSMTTGGSAINAMAVWTRRLSPPDRCWHCRSRRPPSKSASQSSETRRSRHRRSRPASCPKNRRFSFTVSGS